jgi:threonine synthase
MSAPMLFYSTNRQSPDVSFRDALIRGQAPDRGLYMPTQIPVLDHDTRLDFKNKSYAEIAFTVAWPYLEGVIGKEELTRLVTDAYNFDVPLEHVKGRSYVMRLDQGPTASFKDFAARLMGRLMQYFLKSEQQGLTILTATSGDTGSAVANAFYGLDNIRVVVLYPKAEVTDRQRRQMTTLGKNISVLGLDAKFDDCQALVKQAFSDPGFTGLNLSSANSINIGRLIPQIVYYFYAWSRLNNGTTGDQAVVVVPSGNFGDMMGGVLAMKMGLPVKRMVIATNSNDEFPNFLKTAHYQKIEPSRNCISSAMNVGHPSNLARLIDLYGGRMDERGTIHRQADITAMRNDLYAISINDETTRETIRQAYQQYRLILEPHGAVGWAGLQSFIHDHPDIDPENQLCISLETAHPAKFPDEVYKLTGIDPDLPASLRGIDEKAEYFEEIPKDYASFKHYLLKNTPCI